MLQLVVALLGLVCAAYGIRQFTGNYTCWVVKWNSKLKKWCVNLAWVPSALCVVVILGMTLVRSGSLMM